MKAFKCTGLWWLPHDEETQVAGTLRVSANGSLKLSLVGALGTFLPSSVGKVHPVILGSVDNNPLGNKVTLTRCAFTGSTVGSFAGIREKYRAALGFFGEHLVEGLDFSFKELVLRVGGLEEWGQSLSGFVRGQVPRCIQGEKVPLLQYVKHAPVVSAVPEATLALEFGLGSHRSLMECSFTEEAWFSVTCEGAKSHAEFNKSYVYPLQNLMTFACDRPQAVERFSLWRESAAGDAATVPEVKVVGARVQPEDDGFGRGPTRGVEMLFTLKDIDFSDFISKWLRLTEVYSAACNIFFGLQYGPPAYVDMTFLHVAQCLSLYYTRCEDGLALRENEERRLQGALSALPAGDGEWLIDHLGVRPYPPFQSVLHNLLEEHREVMDPLVSNRQDRFVNEVMNTLHYVIRRDPEVRLAASQGADLYWMMQKLRFLMKACFLRELGFSAEKAQSLFERNDLYAHMRQLEAERNSARQAP